MDYRSDPMPSSEGRGLARKAWDGYQRGARKVLEPAIGPLTKSFSSGQVCDLVGFWVIWHLEGGFEGLRRVGMSRAAIYRRVALFRRIFGEHPDEYVMPGVVLDLARYQTEGRAAMEKRKGKLDSL